MVKIPSYSYSAITVLTPYGPFTCAVVKMKSEASFPGLTGGLLPKEGDVVATSRHSVIHVWTPSWDLD